MSNNVDVPSDGESNDEKIPFVTPFAYFSYINLVQTNLFQASWGTKAILKLKVSSSQLLCLLLELILPKLTKSTVKPVYIMFNQYIPG